MADLRDYTGKNRRFTGTDAETISSGTTAERVNGTAKLRFNTTTNLMEYYDGTDWKAIDAPPVISGFTVDDVGGSSVTSATVDNEKSADSGLFTIEVLGSLFDTTGASVTFIATTGNGETINTESITRNSANKLTVTVTASNFDVANSPYSIRVTNGSGLSANLEACITADTDSPTFTNAADTNFDIFDSTRGSVSIAADDLVGASNTDSYAVQSGSLPSGLSLNTTTGVISGSTSAVGSDTQSTFTIRATNTEATADRQFSITLKAPQRTTYNSGSGTFSVPSGVTSVDVLVIASGGPGGSRSGGGGGAGGMIERALFPVTPGSNLSYSVGGQGPQPSNGTAPTRGSNSTFGTLTALAGGAGQMDNQGQVNGGSGGGRHYDQDPTGLGQQPSQPGDSGNYGHGHPGGRGIQGPHHAGGGGGGAGSTGGSGSGSTQGAGGQGRASNYSGSSVTYAGGGGAGGHPNAGPGGAGGPGGGGSSNPGGNNSGNAATSNRGSGGGGAFQASSGGQGGSGIIIVKY